MAHPRIRVAHIVAIVMAAMVCALLPGAPWHEREAGSDPDRGPEPSDWFYAQRAFPSGTINNDVVIAAMDQARAARMRMRTSSGGAWQAAGPFNIGGRIAALAVAPGGTTIYLGAAAGGVFKSTDSGVNWTSVFDQESAFSIGALALDPSDPGTVYCGTGESNAAIDNYDGSGLYRSQDGGGSWQYIGLAETRRIARVAVDPSNPSRIFVAATGSQFSTGPDRGLYRSENGGTSWSKVLFVNDSTGCADVVINPAHPETVYCATWERVRRPTYRRAYGPGCGVWRSIDHGTTWTRLAGGLPAPGDNVGRIGLGMSPSQPSIVYAQIITGTSGGYTGLGMYRTIDGGATWTHTDIAGYTGNFGGFGWYFGEVVVDPNNSNTVYSLGVTLMRSTDGGVGFSPMPGSFHVDQHALWVDPANPSHLYLGNDGGFYSTTTGGSSGWFLPNTLDITQFYAGTIDATNPSRLLGGAQDNSTTMTTGSPTGWTTIYGGDGFYVAVDPVVPTTIFAEYQNGSGGSGPQRSTNNGLSFSAPSGISGSNRFNWMTPFVMNPKNHNLLLVGSQKVYRSTNNGQNYTALSADLTTNNTSASLVYSTITTMDISPADTSVYYVGTDDGRVWRSINRGGTWTNISAGLPLRWVTRVTADPADSNVVYVTLSGFSQDEYAAHVYRSPNRGFTWFPISGNLPDIPVNDIVVDPGQPQWLYVATDLGVYASFDLGETWAPFGTGLPFTAVFDLTIHNASRTLVAATHGRSQWRLQLDTAPVAVEPVSIPASRLALSAPRPNPSRGETQMTLEMDARGHADVGVFDAGGRRVRSLLAERIEAGPRSIHWDGRDDQGQRAAAGVYFVRVRTASGEAHQRLVRVE